MPASYLTPSTHLGVGVGISTSLKQRKGRANMSFERSEVKDRFSLQRDMVSDGTPGVATMGYGDNGLL